MVSGRAGAGSISWPARESPPNHLRRGWLAENLVGDGRHVHHVPPNEVAAIRAGRATSAGRGTRHPHELPGHADHRMAAQLDLHGGDR